MARSEIVFADLTHTSQGISAATFPLGISFVASYAKQMLGHNYDLSLYKFPDKLDQALQAKMPRLLCMSNYSWNFELAYHISKLAKQRDPNLIVVFGGPNFPIVAEEKIEYLSSRPAIDFYIELEGELGFVDLVQKLEKYDLDASRLKRHGEPVLNTSYLQENDIVTGQVERIMDITQIPSPYLTGVLDPFFDLPLAPMIETTRGCPFSCAFCADGIKAKSKVRRFDDGRTEEEIRYIGKHIKHSDELIITDLNYGMYQEDLHTAEHIAKLQETTQWPILVKASAGKNKPERVIEAATILNGSWMVGSAIQSSDPDVLKAIRRGNISSDAFTQFIEFTNGLSKDALTYTEVILGLPGDTKEKHFESLNYGIINEVNSLRMYQAIMLMGTEMSTPQSRENFGLLSRFRTIPGCVGIYNLFGEDFPIAEIEEIIVGSNTMSFEEYADCRVMNLMIETFYNNALFEEAFNMLRAMEVPVFDVLYYLKTHEDLYSPRIHEIIDSFVDQTVNDLFDSRESANACVLTPETTQKYIAGELGINELLVHKAMLYMELPDIADLLFQSIEAILQERDLLTPKVAQYIDELQRLIVYRKGHVTQTNLDRQDMFTFDFDAVYEADCRVNPNDLPTQPPTEYTFYHDPHQKEHIDNQNALYSDTPIGLGRFIQRSNLKKMYRRFKPVEQEAVLA